MLTKMVGRASPRADELTCALKIRRLAGTLAPPSVACPDQIEHSPLEGPILNSLAEVLPDRILLHIQPLFRIAFAIAQSVMPTARLKLPCVLLVLSCEHALPIGNPCLNRKAQIARSAHAMNMIRHQQIITHEPRSGFHPCLM